MTLSNIVFNVLNVPVIFDPNRPKIQGVTMRDIKVPRVKEKRVATPMEFYKMHKMVTITVDVIFINGFCFW